MITSVPRRAVGRAIGLTLRAIGMLLLMLLIEQVLIAIRERRRFVDLVAKRAQPAYDHRRDDDADSPCDDNQDDPHGKLQKRRTHMASRRCLLRSSCLQ